MPGLLIREVQNRRDVFIRKLPEAIEDYTGSIGGGGIVFRGGEKPIELELVTQDNDETG